MKNYKYFEYLPDIIKLKLINKFYKIISKKNTKISFKLYKYYITLIKQYKFLGILSFKYIKFIKIK